MAHRPRKSGRRKKYDKTAPAPMQVPAPKPGDVVQDYKLGQEIGRGGFGAVFKALNVRTGELVAIKRMPLRNVEADLTTIQSEIDLLKMLRHPNIVKYVDSVRTTESFFIVLEFMENGSLAQTISKFGTFSETLAAVFTAQVLQGLAYLHGQGVIHRDIKGANILTTKDGLVKLADFGVAISASEKSNSVVGTPYWMAPEIIEMSGPSAACDIWSVGCLVIELLTGKPPYFDLPPMAALFRIVQDDYPPIPDTVSPALRDFLAECFKKEPTFRKSAEELLKHPWVTIPLKGGHVPGDAEEKDTEATAQLDFAGSMSKPTPVDGGGGLSGADFAAKHTSMSIRVSREELEAFGSIVENTMNNTIRSLFKQRSAEPAATVRHHATPSPIEAEWDREYGEIAPRARLVLPGAPVEGLPPKPPGSTRAAPGTARFSEVPDGGTATTASHSTNMGSRAVLDDLILDDGSSDEEGMRLLAAAHRRDSSTAAEPDSRARAGAVTSSNADAFLGMDDDEEDWTFDVSASHVGDVPVPKLPLARPHSPAAAAPAPGSNGGAKAPLARYADDDAEEDWSEFDQPISGVRAPAPRDDGDAAFDDELEADRLRKVLQRRLASKNDRAVVEVHGGAFQDPKFEDHEFHRDSARDLQSKQQTSVMDLTRLLTRTDSSEELLDICHRLVEFFHSTPSLRRYVVTHHGVLPMLDVLSAAHATPDGGTMPHSPKVLEAVLKVVNHIVADDKSLQESLSLVGVLPAVVKFTSPLFPTSVRLQASLFVEQLCTSSQITLQMFVACDGVQVLVNLLQPSTEITRAPPASALRVSLQQQEQALLRIALSGIISVFKLKRVTKNEFYRLFMRVGLLLPLARALREAFLFLCAHFGSDAKRELSPGEPVSGRWELSAWRPTGLDVVLSTAGAARPGTASAPFPQRDSLSHGSESSGSEDDDDDDDWMVDFKSNLHMKPAGLALTDGPLTAAVGTAAAVLPPPPPAVRRGPAQVLPDTPTDVDTSPAMQAMAACGSIVEILLLFSQGDTEVKQKLSIHDIVVPLLRMLRPAPLSLLSHPKYAPTVVRVLKTIKHLSMDPAGLAVLGDAGAVGMLVPFLVAKGRQVVPAALLTSDGEDGGGSRPSGGNAQPATAPAGSHWAISMATMAASAVESAQMAKDVQNHVVHALFYLCRVNKVNQENAARAGVIPALQDIVRARGALKQLALPILCDLAFTNDRARDMLWDEGGVLFYVGLLREPYWQVVALNALSVWLTHDTKRVQAVLLQPKCVDALVALFQDARKATFQSLLAPLHNMLDRGQKLAAAFGGVPAFMAELAHRLAGTEGTIVLKNLLYILRVVLATGAVPKEVCAANELAKIVSRLAERSDLVVVNSLAAQVLEML